MNEQLTGVPHPVAMALIVVAWALGLLLSLVLILGRPVGGLRVRWASVIGWAILAALGASLLWWFPASAVLPGTTQAVECGLGLYTPLAQSTVYNVTQEADRVCRSASQVQVAFVVASAWIAAVAAWWAPRFWKPTT